MEDEGVGNVLVVGSLMEFGVNLFEVNKMEKLDVDFENSFVLFLSVVSRFFYVKWGKFC